MQEDEATERGLDHGADIQKRVGEVFGDIFPRTPHSERLADILRQAKRLQQAPDFEDQKFRLGNLLASAIQCCNEVGISIEDVVDPTLAFLKEHDEQYRRHGRRLRIAVYGGAFDPITKGHVAVANHILNHTDEFDQVWLMPCYAHMFGKQMTHSEHRSKMVKIASSQEGRLDYWGYEIANRFEGSTYQLCKLIQDEEFAKSKFDFSFVIGLDNANSFHLWKDNEHLRRLMSFVVVDRPGIERNTDVDWYMHEPHMYVPPSYTLIETSSTLVRGHLDVYWKTKSKEVEKILRENLPDGVFEYIVENQLYKDSTCSNT